MALSPFAPTDDVFKSRSRISVFHIQNASNIFKQMAIVALSKC